MQGDEAQAAVVDFNVELVDTVFIGSNLVHVRFIALNKNFDGMMDHFLGKASHLQEAVAKIFQILIKVPLHRHWRFHYIKFSFE